MIVRWSPASRYEEEAAAPGRRSWKVREGHGRCERGMEGASSHEEEAAVEVETAVYAEHEDHRERHERRRRPRVLGAADGGAAAREEDDEARAPVAQGERERAREGERR